MPEDTDVPVETESMGAGEEPAGESLAGFGSVATVATSPAVSAGSRYLNPLTRDYEIATETGQQAQMPQARQRVLLALITVRGSSTANPRFGLNVPRKMGTHFESQMRAAIRSALAHLTRESAQVITIDRIDIAIPRGGRAQITVSFTDVSTGKPDEAKVGI